MAVADVTFKVGDSQWSLARKILLRLNQSTLAPVITTTLFEQGDSLWALKRKSLLRLNQMLPTATGDVKFAPGDTLWALERKILGMLNQLSLNGGGGGGTYQDFLIDWTPTSDILSQDIFAGNAGYNSAATTINLRQTQLQQLSLTNMSSLKSVTAPNLTATLDSSQTSVNLFNLPALTSFSFSVLQSVAGDLAVDSCATLLSVTFPALTTISGRFGIVGFKVNNLASVTSVSCPALTTCAGNVAVLQSNAVTSVSFPVLTGVPATASVSINGASIATLNLNSFATAGAMDFSGCALTTVALPALTHIGASQYFGAGTNNGGGNPASPIVSLSIPQLVFGGSDSVDFQGCALNAASVNLVLRRCVVSNLGAGSTISLQGGTNAAPSGQGIADKATLIANGATVTTN